MAAKLLEKHVVRHGSHSITKFEKVDTGWCYVEVFTKAYKRESSRVSAQAFLPEQITYSPALNQVVVNGVIYSVEASDIEKIRSVVNA